MAVRPEVAKRILAAATVQLVSPSIVSIKGEGEVRTGKKPPIAPTAGSISLFAEPAPSEAKTISKRENVALKLKSLQEAVDIELKSARMARWVLIAVAGLTILMSIGAGVLSNIAGTLTTVFAGTGSTAGVVATSRDQLFSYSSLKTKYKVKLVRLQGELAACGDDEGCLSKVSDGIDKVYEALEGEQVIPDQSNSPSH